ncbi:MAG: TatD family hydrolase [Luteolibacter sp.]
MITDSHCHLASARFSEGEAVEIISRAEAAGVHRMVTLATSLEDLEKNLELANDARVAAAIGIHPCDVHNAPDDAVARLAEHMGDSRVCAIGETGLDYFHPAPEGWEEANFRKRQRDFLVSHFELAAEAGLNVVIHTRDKQGSASFEDALEIYSGYSGKVRAVFHCFISAWELGEKVIAQGGLVSFGGVSTFKNAHVAKDAATRCPAGSFMMETDSPYLAPEPMRGKRNEPAYSSHIAARIAELRGESLASLAAHTESAVDGFFRWRNNQLE